MSLKLVYKIFIIAIILLCARTEVWAQGKFVVINSTHNYRVNTVNPEHYYKWTVIDAKDKQLKFKKIGDVYVVSEDGDLDEAEGLPASIKWENVEIGGKYTLKLTEGVKRSGCSVDSEMEITIINKSLAVDFEKDEFTKCGDEGNDGFMIPLSIKTLEGGDVGDISNSYPFTVEFYISYNGGTEELISMKLESGSEITYVYADRRPDFKEDLSEDHIFKLRFKSVKDKYGADMDIDPDSKFTFKAVKTPVMKTIIFD